jgi:hypothetical protein
LQVIIVPKAMPDAEQRWQQALALLVAAGRADG